MSRRHPDRRGYALVVVLMLISLLIAGGALMMQELVSRATLLRQETSELQLQTVLDSAVAYMMAKYRYELYFEGEDTLKVGDGQAGMTAQVVGLTLRRVTIVATCHGLRRKIEITLQVASDQAIRLLDWQPVVGEAGFSPGRSETR